MSKDGVVNRLVKQALKKEAGQPATETYTVKIIVQYDAEKRSKFDVQEALLKAMPENLGIAMSVRHVELLDNVVDKDDVPVKTTRKI